MGSDRSHEQALELAVYQVAEIVGGEPDPSAPVATLAGGRLIVNASGLAAAAAAAPSIASAEVHLVRPGEPVRVADVLDAVLPAVKPDDPGITFPGALGRLALAGRGRTNRLNGVAVLASASLSGLAEGEASELPDSFVDMSGPGAERTRWSGTGNVVIRFEPRKGAPVADVDRAIRRATLRASRELAAASIGAEPDAVEVIPAVASRGLDGRLPRVCAIVQVGSEGPLLDTYYYGHPMRGISPTLVDHREILDGALTSGAYDWAAARNPTASYQDSALLRELLAADGGRAHFVGVIVALGYLSSAFEKQRSAMLAAQLAQRLGAEGAICTTFETGNSHTDTMLTVRACERLGIATTAILAETNGGLTDHVPEADCLVSVGNEEELVPVWTPERVIGEGPARVGELVPMSSYLGANCEMGDMRWTAVPA